MYINIIHNVIVNFIAITAELVIAHHSCQIYNTELLKQEFLKIFFPGRNLIK